MNIKPNQFTFIVMTLLATTHLITPMSVSAASCDTNITGASAECDIDTNDQALVIDPAGVVTSGVDLNGVRVIVGTNAGDITNYGTIDTVTNVGRSGIHVNTDAIAGAISNMEGATINAELTGIYIQGNTSSISNNGNITGMENNGIHVNNANIANDIINDVEGYIYTAGTHLTDAAGILVRNGSTVVGDVINRGSIEGNAGIYVDNATVSNIVNEGFINVNLKGINITHADTEITSVINHGQITGNEEGIHVYAATVGSISNRIDDVDNHDAYISTAGAAILVEYSANVGSIFNNGIIGSTGAQGIYVYSADITGAIENEGELIGNMQALYAANSAIGSISIGENGWVVSTNSHAVDIDNTTIANGITNNGKIEAVLNSVGIKLHHSLILAGGISNLGEYAIINSGIGIGLDTGSVVNGNIVNSGQINATATGISVDGSQLIGNIVNEEDGTIKADGVNGTAIHIVGSEVGNIENRGIINEADYGIVIESKDMSPNPNAASTAGNITNFEGAEIDVAGDAIAIIESTAGNILNQGTLYSNYSSGIYTYDSTVGNITNDADALITADDGYAINIEDSIAGNILNEEGARLIASSIGIYLEDGSEVGEIVNRGSITAGGYGIRVEDSIVTNDIENAGIINATNEDGISISGGQADNITNSGDINAGGDGIRVSSTSVISGDIVNTGTIEAGDRGIYVTGGSTVKGIFNHNSINSTGSGDSAIRISSGATVEENITLSNGSLTVGENGITISDSEVQGDIIIGTSVSTTNPARLTATDGHALSIGYNGDDGSTVGNITNNGIMRASLDALGIGDGSTVGNITNNYQMIGQSGYGIVALDSTVGNIVNSTNARIEGHDQDGIKIAGATATAGDILNDTNASIFGNYKGINVENNATVASITNNGRITSNEVGINIDESEVTNGIVNNTGAVIQGDQYAVKIVAPSADITFDNYGALNGAIMIEDTTLNLEDGTVATGTIGGAGGVVNINTNFATSSDYGVDDGALAEINIASGKTFTAQADGIVFETQDFNNNGTLSVLNGNVINIVGDYNQTIDGMLRLQASSTTEFGQLAVDGDSTFTDGTGIYVDVINGSNFAGGLLEDVITVSGTLNADASTFIVNDNSYLFNFSALEDGPNNIDLVVTQDAINSVKEAVKQQNNNPSSGAAAALDNLISLNPGGDVDNVINAFGALTNAAQVSDAASQTLPVLTGGSAKAIMQVMGATNQVVQARQSQNLGLSSGEDFVENNNFWLKPFGTWSNQGTDNGVVGFDANTYGVVVGADKATSDSWRIGVALAYASTDMKSHDARNKLDVDTYQITTYGSYVIDPKTEVNLQADVGYNNNNSTRVINFGGLNRVAKGDFASLSAHLGAGIGQVFDVTYSTTITPTARVDYSVISNDSYTESDAGALNLRVKSQTIDQLLPSLGAKLNQNISDNFSFSANAGVGYDVLNDRNSITASYVGGGGAFTTNGLKPSPWVVSTGASLTYNANDNYNLTVGYDREDRGEFDSQTASIKLRMPF